MSRNKFLKNINTVLFDVDGTLLNTTEFIFRSFEYTFKKMGAPLKSRIEIATLIGKPLEECYQHLAPSLPTETLCKIHKAFQLDNLHLVTPFTNTKKTLRKLKKNYIKIGAITTRSKQTSIKTLIISEIYQFLDTVISQEDVIYCKPHPEPLLKTLKILKADKKNSVMVGDTESDILAGKNAGISTIGAAYGFHKKKIGNAKPDFIIYDISEVLQLIN